VLRCAGSAKEEVIFLPDAGANILAQSGDVIVVGDVLPLIPRQLKTGQVPETYVSGPFCAGNVQ
jgi:hypothetical protein